jgi:transcriptional regulator with XRE-family HTH domain
MVRKNTIAALRIKKELKDQSLTGIELSEMTSIPYSAIANILAGKSSKIEKLEVIAKALGKPLLYFLNADNNENDDKSAYDGELHYKTLKRINDYCRNNKIHLTKDKMNQLVDFVYPRLKKDDPEDLMVIQTEALVNYLLKNPLK